MNEQGLPAFVPGSAPELPKPVRLPCAGWSSCFLPKLAGFHSVKFGWCQKWIYSVLLCPNWTGYEIGYGFYKPDQAFVEKLCMEPGSDSWHVPVLSTYLQSAAGVECCRCWTNNCFLVDLWKVQKLSPSLPGLPKTGSKSSFLPSSALFKILKLQSCIHLVDMC